MKSSIKKYLKQIKYFKLMTIFIAVIFSISLGAINKNASIIEGINSVLSYNLIICIVLSIFMSNILFLNKNLFNNYSYILRFKDKNRVLNNNISMSYLINFGFYLAIVIVIVIASFIRVINKTVEVMPLLHLLLYIMR